MSELGSLKPAEMVNKYSAARAYLGGWIVVGPRSGSIANFVIKIIFTLIGLGLVQYVCFMFPRGFYITCLVMTFLYLSVLYNTLS
jgi:hypothetical protein